MRIACLHLSGFALQAQLRGALDSTIRAEPWAVVGPKAGSPAAGLLVISMSRAAADAGVRLGQSVYAARAAAPSLHVLEADRASWAGTLQAVGEALLSLSDCVDIVGQPRPEGHDVFAHVPARMRGDVFGAKVEQVLGALGLRCKIGIADDRFTAWVAAGSAIVGAPVSVPRGGAAAFLAPRPLALLGLDGAVLGMLAAGGVKTLGAFAELPAPSPTVHGPRDGWDADLQALARGDGSARLHPFVPHATVAEHASVILDGDKQAVALDALEYARCIVARVRARLDGRSDVPVAFVVEGASAADACRIEVGQVDAGAPGVSAVPVEEAVERTFSSVEQVIASTLLRRSRCVVRAEFAEVIAAAPAANDSAPSLIDAIGDVHLGASSVTLREPHRRTRRGKLRSRQAQFELFSESA